MRFVTVPDALRSGIVSLRHIPSYVVRASADEWVLEQNVSVNLALTAKIEVGWGSKKVPGPPKSQKTSL